MTSVRQFESEVSKIHLNMKKKFVLQFTELDCFHIISLRIIKATYWNVLNYNPSCNKHKWIVSKLCLIFLYRRILENGKRVVPEREEPTKTPENSSENQDWKEDKLSNCFLRFGLIVFNLIHRPHLRKISFTWFRSFFF